ncbi:flavin reductase family protein [Paenalkalicoccus suaedae]|uniref:Flavin reductase family protein n=1 Tax=Paenalkalicoccus suaedae TaxID=2592382 RepID=A0A859FEL6_9BACI|nr:flavin reductase family protein [Paenalkalicoccus suaedae]QKS71288.1 flavin reductase family protein [Paenalkalicoccus suaedae]
MDEAKVSTFKDIMGNYPTGVTVCTTMAKDGTPIGLTVNSFASVSLDPMLILWSIDKNVSSHDEFVESGKFAVHVLAENQGDVCMLFATKGTDRFSNVDWSESEAGLPVLKEAAGIMQCNTFKTVDAGDHTILIGEVTELTNDAKEPLLYHKRAFGKIPSSFYEK